MRVTLSASSILGYPKPYLYKLIIDWFLNPRIDLVACGILIILDIYLHVPVPVPDYKIHRHGSIDPGSVGTGTE